MPLPQQAPVSSANRIRVLRDALRYSALIRWQASLGNPGSHELHHPAFPHRSQYDRAAAHHRYNHYPGTGKVPVSFRYHDTLPLYTEDPYSGSDMPLPYIHRISLRLMCAPEVLRQIHDVHSLLQNVP